MYIARPPISLKKITLESFYGKVLFPSINYFLRKADKGAQFSSDHGIRLFDFF